MEVNKTLTYSHYSLISTRPITKNSTWSL